ncbi:MAG: hypothetical protein ACI4XC_01140 [Eubacterium sp.]|uniref:hypothetical protein n=1 Tax=Eubacterium coprostanoligenes TaxID=290054 RepID=UPI00240988D8|nr:hypothetical protein [Eubacterium coprostanoligenes]MDD6665311.1 hypothetical protein [Eubacterium coprostanoligenes]
MSKTKKEIQEMATYICKVRNQFMFNKRELCEITGLCYDTIGEICKKVTPASTGKSNLYFIQDFLNQMYNG